MYTNINRHIEDLKELVRFADAHIDDGKYAPDKNKLIKNNLWLKPGRVETAMENVRQCIADLGIAEQMERRADGLKLNYKMDTDEYPSMDSLIASYHTIFKIHKATETDAKKLAEMQTAVGDAILALATRWGFRSAEGESPTLEKIEGWWRNMKLAYARDPEGDAAPSLTAAARDAYAQGRADALTELSDTMRSIQNLPESTMVAFMQALKGESIESAVLERDAE